MAEFGEGNTVGIDYTGDRDNKGSGERGEFTFEEQKTKEPLPTALWGEWRSPMPTQNESGVRLKPDPRSRALRNASLLVCGQPPGPCRRTAAGRCLLAARAAR